MVAPKQAKKSAAAVEIEFTRPYLIHPDGRIVWSQRKAYMDTPGAVLYLDVLLNPYRIKSGRRNATLIWDNCKTHNRPCVLEAFEKSSFFVDFLPKNMTDSMQPVDIIACGPLKAGQRALRVEDLYTYQQEFASDMDAALKKKGRGAASLRAAASLHRFLHPRAVAHFRHKFFYARLPGLRRPRVPKRGLNAAGQRAFQRVHNPRRAHAPAPQKAVPPPRARILRARRR